MTKPYFPRPKRRSRPDAVRGTKAYFRLADDEREAIEAAAAAEGLSVSAWLRGTAISASASYLPNASSTAGGAVAPN
jgi:uncharacterized protein (DUF1778 family)